MIHRQPSETSTARSGKRRPRPSKRRDRFGDKRRLTLEGLENRQLLAGGLGLIANNGTLEEFDGPRNVGTVTAFQVNEDEGIGDFGENDFFQDAQEVPLGLMPGQQDTIDIRGTAGFETRGNVSFTTDIDTYAVNLKAGDILDVATIGASTQFTVLLGLNESGGRIQGRTEGSIWFGVDGDPNVIGEEQSTTYPANSPLQTFGEQAFAQVVPESGTYYIQVAANTTTINYTLGLRVYRPVTESLPIGERQIVFLDFDGGVFPRDLLTALYTDENAPVGGIVRLPDLQETLSDNGFAGVSDAQYQFFVRQIINKFEAAYENIGDRNLNGDFVSTGIPGDYAVTVLNSIDHPDPGSAPNVSRIQMSGTEADYGFSALIAESVDVGNFLLNEYAVVQFDVVAGLSADFPVESIGRLEAIGTFMANVAIHEAGHIFGMRHTDGENPTATLSDEGGSVNSFSQLQEVGNDGIAGTIDDELLLFETDRFSLLEGIFGTNFIGSSLAFGLSTGTEGTLPTGTVFGDEAGDGSSLGDSGLPGVTLFMDLDRDGIQDPGEPATVSASDGSYSFAAPQSVFTTNPGPDIYAIVPSNFESSNVSPLNTRTITDLSGTSRTAVRATGSLASLPDFGFTELNPGVQGQVLDVDTLAGIPGVFVYADLDGDNIPDTSEPSSVTDANGNYSLDVTPTGLPYAIRVVNGIGLEVVFPGPPENEYNEIADGAPLSDRDFNMRASIDFGDAPSLFGTLLADDGPRHAIIAGLSIGTQVDREVDGQPSSDALGDDISSVPDDEDGLSVNQVLRAGSNGTINVQVTNTTGQTAFLQGWIDFDQSNSFEASEALPIQSVTASGNQAVTFAIPNTAQAGDTFSRLRLGYEGDLTPLGPAFVGEVEDHVIRITAAGSGDTVSPDTFNAPRNVGGDPPYVPRVLDVLLNDFNTSFNPLDIIAAGAGASGTVQISSDSVGDEVLFYTPRPGFTGIDTFSYTVEDSDSNTFTTTVTVNVAFTSDSPIAVDDTFFIAQGDTAVPLNVTENDIASTAGDFIISFASIDGTSGGSVQVDEENQSVTYSPPPGFAGTQTFEYTITSNGVSDTAEVTVVVGAAAEDDDLLGYSFAVVDTNGSPVSTLQAGDQFELQVFVDDLRSNLLPPTDPRFVNVDDPQGVAAAYLDVLYTAELVRFVDGDSDGDPDIVFGSDFISSSVGDTDVFQAGDTSVPGLINDIGSTQPLFELSPVPIPPETQAEANARVEARFRTDPQLLFSVTMEATGTGVVVFQANQADDVVSDSAILFEDDDLIGPPDAIKVRQEPVEVEQQRLGFLELTIAPGGDNFPAAIDDAFHDGENADGDVFSASSFTALDVLDNDLFVPGEIRSLEISRGIPASDGTLSVDNRGTASADDDVINYRPAFGFSGFEDFTYTITIDSSEFGTVVQTGRVTLVVGDLADPQVRYVLGTVDINGNPIAADSINVGDVFGVLVQAEEILPGLQPAQTVFGGFLDVLYDAGAIEPTFGESIAGLAPDFNFDVRFDTQFNVLAAVGVDANPGLIDEFGSFLLTNDTVANGNNNLATIFFRALQPGVTRVASSPADRFPQQETVVNFGQEGVPIDEIEYRSLDITIGLAAGGEPIQNRGFPVDVNGDGFGTAVDALLVINELSKLDAAGEPGLGASSQFFFDVDGNGRVTAVDALRVINYLNGVGSQGRQSAPEPIGPAESSDDDSTESLSAATSSIVIGSQPDEPLLPATGATQLDVAADSVIAASDAATASDDDDDEMLGLLADDVATIWND